MNEYRWYPNEQRPVENMQKPKPKPEKKKHTVLCSVIASAAVCGVLMCCFGAVMMKTVKKAANFAPITVVDDGREKSDMGDIITPSDSGMLSVSEISEKVSPCVVGILSKGTMGGFFNRDVDMGSGSGVIISADGYVVTNNHVIENANSLTVVLGDAREYTATVVGADERTDIAVLKIDGENLPTAVLGNSAAVKVGELAVAIGNPLGQELAGSVTVGVISAVNRNLDVQGKSLTLLQTDAAINPGNSGGALVNCYGEVVGINTVKLSSTSIEGIGFAIPISEAKPVIDELIKSGKVTGRPLIGIGGSDAPYGVIVESVNPGSAAETAGVQKGDLIIKFDGETVKSVDEINKLKERHKAGDAVKMTIYRDGELLEVDLILGEE